MRQRDLHELLIDLYICFNLNLAVTRTSNEPQRRLSTPRPDPDQIIRNEPLSPRSVDGHVLESDTNPADAKARH